MLRKITNSLMVNARVSEAYIHFALIYTTGHIFPVLPIKDLINEDGYPITPFNLATGTKPSVSYLRVLFCLCVVRKATAHIGTKALNMHHQAQKGFHGIFDAIPKHQKGFLVYVPNTRKIISSYDVIFDKSFSSALAYKSQPYSEAMEMSTTVAYTHYTTSPREQTGNIITFTQFEEGNKLNKTHNDAENVDKPNDNSIMPLLLSEGEMDAMDS